MKRKGYVLSIATIAWIGIMGWVVTVHPQAGRGQLPAPPGQQPAAPAAAAGGGGGQRGGGLPGTESGWSTFQTRCAVCHSNPGPNRGPTSEAIRLMTPEKIAEALTTGKMKTQGTDLNEGQIRRVAEFMSGRPMGSSGPGDAKNMPNKCANNPPITNLNAGWIGWAPCRIGEPVRARHREQGGADGHQGVRAGACAFGRSLPFEAHHRPEHARKDEPTEEIDGPEVHPVPVPV